MLTTFRLHRELSARWWPTRDATYRADAAWLPRLPATLQGVIDHVGLLALGQKPGARTSQAIATVLGIPLNRRMRRKDFHYWTLRSILASLLDSPAHLRR
jgi:hypothetical protein